MLQRVLAEGVDRPLAGTFALLTVFSKLVRVSDQAKNVCEETLFELTGETKPPKRYQILFVDDDCATVAPLAVALARKAFPESGQYACAARAPAAALAPALEALAEKLGLDLGGVEPAKLPTEREALENFHVVVCLTADAVANVPHVPYATTLLGWTPSPQGAPLDLDAVARALTGEIRELMVTLRGAEAD
jgi:hypothetical protein